MYSEITLPAGHTRVREGQASTDTASLKIGFYSAEDPPLKLTASVGDQFDEFSISTETAIQVWQFIHQHIRIR